MGMRSDGASGKRAAVKGARGKAKTGRVVARPYGALQRIRPVTRKLFDRRRKKRFIEHLAATCNVRASAHAAGVTQECAYQHRAKDAAFRAAWTDALEIAEGRLRTEMLEEAVGHAAIEIDGEVVVPAKPFDADLAKFLLREHGRGLAGIPRGGAKAKAADWQEIEDALIRRFKALGLRLRAARGEGEVR